MSPFYAAMPLIFIALMAGERLMPLRRRTRPSLARLLVNGVFGLLAALSVWILVKPVALWSLRSAAAAGTGLLTLGTLPPLTRYILVFLLMDMSFYWWHRANHQLRFLWRFHNVHHFDPDLDVTTAVRFHFGELIFSAAFRIVQLGLVAPGVAEYLAYEAVFQTATWFHHSNFRMPLAVERVLVLAGVTPRMHGIHHSQVRSEANSNYGSVFTWWDRLFGTLRLNVPQQDIRIGVPGYALPDDNSLSHALEAPFRRQRYYWRQNGGESQTRGEGTALAE